MRGNVWELNEAVIDGWYRGLDGGSFPMFHFALHAMFYYSIHPEREGSNVGFRVAMIPEPSSIVLLIIFGGIALARC